MSMRKVAVVGAGMTKFVRRAQETGKELAFEATKMALESCEMTLDDIDCVVHGTAPDSFDGVHMKGVGIEDGFVLILRLSNSHRVFSGTGI